MRATQLALLGLVLVVAGCGDDDRPGDRDAGVDAGRDGGGEMSPDAARDAFVEPDASEDGGGGDEDGGGFEPPARLETFVDEAAGAVCEALMRCCDDESMEGFFGSIVSNDAFESFRPRVPPMATLDLAECTTVLSEIYARRPFGDWVAAASRGEVELVEEELDACITSLEDAACGAEVGSRLFDGECLGFSPPAGGESQRRMFRRTRVAGESCGPISDGLGAGFYGTCDPSVAFCCYRAAGSDDCVFPTAGTVGTCEAVAGEGEECAYGALPLLLCETGFYCDEDGECAEEATTPLANGEACATAGFDILGDCTDGFCDLFGDRTCVARKENGETCTTADECLGGACVGTPRVCATNTFCSDEEVVTIAIMPTSVTLGPGETQVFTATVMGAADASVTWSATAGTIDDAGQLTAPAEVGELMVTATSVADPSVSATATVSVVASTELTVTTLAGGASSGTADGTGADARFNAPAGLALDADGSILVSDSGSARIRRVTAAGVVTTVFAGAPLNTPWGIAVAADGAIWVADRGAHSVFRIAGGEATRVAGSPTNTSGYLDGAGSAARFNAPRGVAFDGDVLLVADSNNHSIRRVTAAGDVTTLVGDGSSGLTDAPLDTARAYFPWAVLVAADGVLVSGTDHCVRRVAGGRFDRIAGLCANFSNTGTTDGPAFDARFDSPRGLAAAATGEVWIADASNNLIRSLSMDRATVGRVAGTLGAAGSAVAGFADGAATTEARFSAPGALLVMPDGVVVVADAGNHRLRLISR